MNYKASPIMVWDGSFIAILRATQNWKSTDRICYYHMRFKDTGDEWVYENGEKVTDPKQVEALEQSRKRYP